MISLMLNGCQHTTDNHLYDTGVSQELAQLRKQVIKDLKYDLSFTISEQKADPVPAAITIWFRLDKAREIILDFREEHEKILSVTANGQAAAYSFTHEHIILPESFLQEGENEVSIRFIAGNQSLNRNDEFLYTLLVPDRARTVPLF